MKSAVALLFVGLLTACAASAPPAAQPEPAPPVPELEAAAAPAPESTAAVGSGDSQSPRAQREQMVIQLLEGRIPETGIPTDAR